MTRITLDSALKAKLGDLTGRVAVCDERGELVGYFVPGPGRERRTPADEPSYTVEQLAAWRATRAGKPLEEILSRLGL